MHIIMGRTTIVAQRVVVRRPCALKAYVVAFFEAFIAFIAAIVGVSREFSHWTAGVQQVISCEHQRTRRRLISTGAKCIRGISTCESRKDTLTRPSSKPSSSCKSEVHAASVRQFIHTHIASNDIRSDVRNGMYNNKK